MNHPVVLIHGAFAGPWCLDNFKSFFESRGWACHTPALRYHDDDPNAAPNSALADVGFEAYTADLEDFIEDLDVPPIIIGHAIGGIIAQKLAARRLASAIVLLNSNSPWGILPHTDEERAVARAMMEAGPFWKAPMRVTFDMMAKYAFNKLDPATQRRVFDRLGAESGKVLFETFFWMFDESRASHVDFEAVKCPVLVVSGEDDRAVPSVTGGRIAEKYEHATFHEAAGQAHYLFMEPGWEDLAVYCADWMAAAVKEAG